MNGEEKMSKANGGKISNGEDMERFAEFIEKQSMTLHQTGWLKGQFNLRRWASELRESVRPKDSGNIF